MILKCKDKFEYERTNWHALKTHSRNDGKRFCKLQNVKKTIMDGIKILQASERKENSNNNGGRDLFTFT